LQQQSQLAAKKEEKEDEDLGIDEHFQIPDELWERIRVLIPPPPPKKNKDRPGRPRMDNRRAMNGIFYVLRTGCQWKALPKSLGAPSTVHDRFQEWRDAEVFENMWKEGLLEHDEKKGINWEWQAMDGAITKLLSGGKSTGPNPTDRSKSGTKENCSLMGTEYLLLCRWLGQTDTT
jgi:putative transposase